MHIYTCASITMYQWSMSLVYEVFMTVSSLPNYSFLRTQHNLRLILQLYIYTERHSSSTLQPSMFIAAPTRWRLPVTSTWTWDASDTSTRCGGLSEDIFVSGLGGGRERSLSAEHQRSARLRQSKVAMFSSFIGARLGSRSVSWLVPLSYPLVTWPPSWLCGTDCSSSHACLLASVLALWQSNVTVRLVWSAKQYNNRSLLSRKKGQVFGVCYKLIKTQTCNTIAWVLTWALIFWVIVLQSVWHLWLLSN